MPMRRELYPPNWQEIVASVRNRSGNHCEGSPAYPDCRAENGQPHPVTGSKVVLTTGHLNHDHGDGRLEVLRHWCQRCHLAYDRPIHAEHARRSRERRAGQLRLPVEDKNERT